MAAKEPEQLFFKISELSEELGVEAHVLRFWEKEFSQIKPLKVGPRKRLYRRKDLETFGTIKRLLYDERYTIAGAKKYLTRRDSQEVLFSNGREKCDDVSADQNSEVLKIRVLLDETRHELLSLRQLLSGANPDLIKKEKDID